MKSAYNEADNGTILLTTVINNVINRRARRGMECD